MTEIKIYRGNQIGGCITEIHTGSTRILIDFGEELPGSGNGEAFAFPWEKRKVDAVFFTHYHGDHIGRFWQVPEEIPLYMSELSWDVLVNIHEYLKENLPWLAKREGVTGTEAARLRQEAEKHGAMVDILKESGAHREEKRIHTFRPHEGKRIEIGDISVTPFWVDHSAADACMFLIETPDKRILHTGDFRGHGIQGENGHTLWEAVKGIKPIDILITEGTMMSRRNERPYAEADLRKDAGRLFAEHRHVFLIISSTNLDSISTFYQAAKENHLSMYGYNPYVGHQIKTLGEYADKRWDGPKMEDVERIRPRDGSQLNKMKEKGFVAIIKANELGEQLIQEFQDCKPVIVYSMWQGYYERKLDTALCNFVDACKEKHIPVYPLTDRSYGPMHTSGHADPKLIAQLIRAADPQKLFPIHTEDAKAFLNLNIPENLKNELKKRLEEEQMVTREETKTEGYSKENDCRCLSGDALEKFRPGQPYHKFVELVKKHLDKDKLIFCFRGNSGDQGTAIIYYKNHVAFAINAKGDVTFNFDHARYLEKWKDQKDALEGYGYTFVQHEETFQKKMHKNKRGTVSYSYHIGTVTMAAAKAEALTEDGLKELYEEHIKVMIESFFCAKREKRYDYFREAVTGEKRLAGRELTEKVAQQELFLALKSLHGYYAYDLEFSQPHAKDLGSKNQPDMMAIRFNGDGKPERLVFVEVKSKADAFNGSSGLKEHINGMENYPDWLLSVRGKDACHILEQYDLLGLIKEKPHRPFVEAEFMKLPKESLLIFTGDAVDELEKPHEAGGVSWEDFLKGEEDRGGAGYELLKGAIPPISLNGKDEEPVVYRKEL